MKIAEDVYLDLSKILAMTYNSETETLSVLFQGQTDYVHYSVDADEWAEIQSQTV